MLKAYDTCAPRLKIRLMGKEQMALSPDPNFTQEKIPGVCSMLMVDTPTFLFGVPHAIAQEWGHPLEALFETALENLRADTALKADPAPHPGLSIVRWYGTKPTAASHALILDRYLARDWRLGHLVCIPDRETLFVHTVTDSTVWENALALQHFTAHAYSTNPGPISQQVYYWHDGEFELFPVHAGAVMPGPKFNAVVTSMFAPPEVMGDA